MSDEVNGQIAAVEMLSPETRALIGGLRGRLPSRDLELDWVSLCQLAVAHRVAPLLHQAWAPYADELPPAVLSDLTMLRRQSHAHGLRGLRERDDILRTLTEANVPVIVLKGAAWARRWYTDVSLRPFSDIDLLIAERDMNRARDILYLAGYRPRALHEGETVMFHHDLPLEHPSKACNIELHRYLLVFPSDQLLRFEDVIDRSIVFRENDVLVPSLDPVDSLVHLCMHLLQHVESNPGWSLLNLWDIVRHVDVCDIDWELFDGRATKAGVASSCRAALGLVVLIAGAAIPDSCADTVSGRRLIGFPLMRYSLTPTYHRGVLSFLEVVSRRDLWRVVPTVKEVFLRRVGKHRPGSLSESADVQSRSFASLPLRALPRELAWVFRESLKSGMGHIKHGIRQIRWEEQARTTVHELVSGPFETDEPVCGEKT